MSESRKKASCALLATGIVAASSVAFAQEGPVAPSAISLTGTPATPAAPAPAPAAVAVAKGESAQEYAGNDHDLFVHHVAVGYFGISQLPVGNGGGAPAIVNAPVIGVRYWATKLVGIDAGLGVGYDSQSVGGAVGSNNSFGMAFHGGLPLALADSKHFTFEVVPIEVTLGFANASQGNQSGRGLRLDVGARVGAELHFGFIGIPQLALEGSIGLLVNYQSFGTGNAPSSSETTFATSVGSDPWAIFTDSISALYYF